MSSTQMPFRHPQEPLNALGYRRQEYEGLASTLCAGCGHDSVSSAIIDACFLLNIAPHKIAKLSGIGCSSKTPAYFLKKSHGFNSVHGRMPSIAMGANMANKDLVYIGVSGDGDTASIGMGQFVHMIRRNLNICYILMNNGCYGLTKGQDSATTDLDSASRKGKANKYQAIDLCDLAMSLGAGFVARGFSGDKYQLIPFLQAGIAHKGVSIIDVISPCVTFNNNKESSKSYLHVRDHIEETGFLEFFPDLAHKQEVINDAVQKFNFIDDSALYVHRKNPQKNLSDIEHCRSFLMEKRKENKIPTGLLYCFQSEEDNHDILETSDKAFNTFNEKDLCPSREKLASINMGFR